MPCLYYRLCPSAAEKQKQISIIQNSGISEAERRRQAAAFSVKPLFKRFKRFESVFSPGALRSEKTDLWKRIGM